MLKTHRAAKYLAPLLDSSTAGELNPELVRPCQQQLIVLETSARPPKSLSA